MPRLDEEDLEMHDGSIEKLLPNANSIMSSIRHEDGGEHGEKVFQSQTLS